MSRKLWCLVLLLPAAAAGCNNSPAQLPAPERPKVKVAEAVSQMITDYEEFQGKTDAEKSVNIEARVSGYLDKVYVGRKDELVEGKEPPIREGTDVKQGQILFVVQEKPFRDALTQAERNLQGLMIQRDFNKRNAERMRTSGTGTSVTDVDNAETAYRNSEEQVAAARATVEIAKQNLEWATIRAPFDGRIGRRMLDRGNVVKADDTILTRIVSLDPIYAWFDVDERTFLKLQRSQEKHGIYRLLYALASPSLLMLQPFLEKHGISANQMRYQPVEMGLSDEKGFPHEGKIDFTDNRIDPDSGSIWLRGVFENPADNAGHRMLTPGLFVRIRLPIGEKHPATLIPEQAVATDQGQKHVWVVDAEGHATSRPVELGAQHGTLRVVEKGIEAGELVITSGLQKVRVDREKHYAEVQFPREEP
jgi:RND family efflux transporter MFP subunit